MVTVQDLKNNEVELANYLVQSQFEVNKAWVEAVNTKGGQLSTLSIDNKVEIARTVYKKGRDGYKALLTSNPTSVWGRGREHEIYEKDTRMSEVDFVNNFISNMSLSNLANIYGRMSSNLERKLRPYVFFGLEDTDLPNMKNDLATESKDRYNFNLDKTKIMTLEDAVKIYTALRKNSAPEEFDIDVNDYKA